MTKTLLVRGNGHQIANRRKALEAAMRELPEIIGLDERTVAFQAYGVCHFAAYTDDNGAMISTPGRDDNVFGSAEWHAHDNIMMLHDAGDGRCMIFVCPIRPLFDKRTIGHHGVRWNDVRKLAKFTHVFRVE
ncbi:hypothetical protein J2800_004234 [Caulobacter rhizosphaerae]|jgi:hypothetical protein|uniref:Uncharacterized protein n=1 Tax=Caulobacter rhizosphaerae TaxID=2010972 RepID=A0ABU1N4W2_9CAUL|nr:hypothetical protein [Caulobacter rhizosphaerae]MDR6533468.1 hypothetical protein [Caulobacter rhizosphaerae]